ncbi:hypothetical protein [Streptomyces sp. NPDC060194]|uniref:hypothetical protein n=1 Tax=Streptomyces sp. NPDC060194 TaxID=3347069 RepID=UPI00365BF898
MHHEILCQITAYGVSGGARIGVPLGTYRAPSLPLALWWLRDRAAWLAARLDPRPDEAWLPPGALTETGQEMWGVPDRIRSWSEDREGQELIGERLMDGELVELRWQDETTEYELLAESTDALRMRRTFSAMHTTGDAPAPPRPASTAQSLGPTSYFGPRRPVDPLHRLTRGRQNA